MHWGKRQSYGQRFTWVLGGVLALSALAIVEHWAAPSAVGQSAAQQAAGGLGGAALDVQTGQLPTWRQLFATSAVINGVILAMSVMVVVLFIYFMLTIHTRSMAPPIFVDDVTKLVINQQYEQAADLCRHHRQVFIASIIQRCVENAGKGHSVIMEMLDSEGRRRADIVWNRVSYLADVSNVAPMLGLLGTVRGMIKTFFLLPTQSASIGSEILSQGIGEAMATTMFGLAVAIMALVFHSVSKARVTRTLAEVEQVAHTIADHLKRGGA